MKGSRYARIFWIGAAGALVLAALVGISTLLRSDFTETDGQVLLTLAALILASGTALAGLTLAERGRVWTGTTAGAVAVVGFMLIAASTWEGFEDEALAKAAGTSALAIVALLVITTQLLRYRGDLTAVVVATCAAVALAFVTTSAITWQEGGDDGTLRVAGSLWIVGGVGWLLLPVLQRFGDAAVEPAAAPRVLAELDGIQLVTTREASGIEVDLDPGERLVLRRSPTG